MREQTREFKRGMSEVISPHWTNMFDSNELQTLISGNNRKIDIDDLRANCVYNGLLILKLAFLNIFFTFCFIIVYIYN